METASAIGREGAAAGVCPLNAESAAPVDADGGSAAAVGAGDMGARVDGVGVGRVAVVAGGQGCLSCGEAGACVADGPAMAGRALFGGVGRRPP